MFEIRKLTKVWLYNLKRQSGYTKTICRNYFEFLAIIDLKILRFWNVENTQIANYFVYLEWYSNFVSRHEFWRNIGMFQCTMSFFLKNAKCSDNDFEIFLGSITVCRPSSTFERWYTPYISYNKIWSSLIFVKLHNWSPKNICTENFIGATICFVT